MIVSSAEDLWYLRGHEIVERELGGGLLVAAPQSIPGWYLGVRRPQGDKRDPHLVRHDSGPGLDVSFANELVDEKVDAMLTKYVAVMTVQRIFSRPPRVRGMQTIWCGDGAACHSSIPYSPPLSMGRASR